MQAVLALALLILAQAGRATAETAADGPEQSGRSRIHLNQLGYYPRAHKIAIVVSGTAKAFEVVNQESRKQVYGGVLQPAPPYPEAGETQLMHADFSALKTPGRYTVRVQGLGESWPFAIGEDILRQAALASAKTYYFQRASLALDKKYAGVYARPAGHTDTKVRRHPSSGLGAAKASPGGWYDAGDFGKYVINAGVTVGTLLAQYGLHPHYFRDGSLNIPESGNGQNDLLDEIRYELDWLRTMQDDDGGVFAKLTSLSFPGMIMPHQDLEERYFIGKSTPAALDFAAMMAKAARVFRPLDPNYSKSLLTAGEKAWVWAKKNPTIAFKNPKDVKTGEYGDQEHGDERLWAATELYLASEGKEYGDYLQLHAEQLPYQGRVSWDLVAPLATLAVATNHNKLNASIQKAVRASIVSKADEVIKQMSSSAYRLPKFAFAWGSNAEVANFGVLLLYAAIISHDEKYLLYAHELADYLLGRNAIGYSFVTGFGAKTPRHPHLRATAADKVEAPIPGFLVGGPNAERQDAGPKLHYPRTEPALSYVDDVESYASNEVAINWNAPWTLLSAGLDATFSVASLK